jgi:ketosteroid isomerase-like protein
MTKFLKVTVLSALVLATLSASAATKPEDAVRKADQDWARVFGAKQLDAAVNACAPTARVLPPNAPLAVGHEQISKLFASFFALSDLKVTWQTDDVHVARSGELAFTTGHYEMSFAGPNGRTIQDHGKYATAWEKSGDGWKVIVDIFNSDLPAAGQ